MQYPTLGPTLWSGAALALLAACTSDVPQGPTLEEGGLAPEAAFAVGLYGMAGTPTGPAGRPCTRPEYRRFDFWLGSWEVVDPTGAPAGTNVIRSELDGCAVMESYAAGGYVGRSLNSYDAATDQWHQHWTDNFAALIHLFGGSPEDGVMVLQGDRPLLVGSILDRVTWTRLSPDLVRQFWQTSSDGGETFDGVQFDGFYHRRPSVTADPEAPQTFCSDAAFPALFQFDFTLGSWQVEVTGPHPSEAGVAHRSPGGPELRSTIAKDLSDCLIEERITGRAGYEATVFTTVRRRRGEWVRTLVDNRGTNVFLSGGETGDRMVLTGTVAGAGGISREARVTWQQTGAGGFEQRWETTPDGGQTWERLLVAEYSRP